MAVEAIKIRGRRTGFRSVATPIPGVDGNPSADWHVLSRHRTADNGGLQILAPETHSGSVSMPNAIARSFSEIIPVRLQATAGIDGIPGADAYDELARERLDAFTDLELELALSARLAAAPSGQLVSVGAVPVMTAIAIASQSLRVATGYPGPVTISLPSWTQGIALATNAFERVGDTYRLGENLVLFGVGITGAGPTGSTAAVPASGTAYVWVTGPLEYALHPTITRIDESKADINRGQVRLIRLAYVDYDPAVARAKLVQVY